MNKRKLTHVSKPVLGCQEDASSSEKNYNLLPNGGANVTNRACGCGVTLLRHGSDQLTCRILITSLNQLLQPILIDPKLLRCNVTVCQMISRGFSPKYENDWRHFALQSLLIGLRKIR